MNIIFNQRKNFAAQKILRRGLVPGGGHELRIHLVLNILISCIIILGFSEASAQARNISKNSIYFELLGHGLFYSINYERAFNRYLSARVGFTSSEVFYKVICSKIYCGADEEDRFNIVPLMLNYRHGQSKHKFEVGLGVAFVSVTKGEFDLGDLAIIEDETRLFGVATIGYRIQPESRGILFRVGFTPFFGEEGIQPWGGLSLGYAW